MIQIYKPNSKNAGSAFTFSSTKDKSGAPVFYISAIAQYGWNDESKTGTFSGNAKNPEKTINVKINEFEAGDFVSAFDHRHEYTSFHSYEGNNTTIKCTPWDKSGKISKYDVSSKSYKESTQVLPAFGITLSKGKGNSIKIGLEPGEVVVLRQLLVSFINSFIEHKANVQQSYKLKTDNKQSNEEDSKHIEEAPF